MPVERSAKVLSEIDFGPLIDRHLAELRKCLVTDCEALAQRLVSQGGESAAPAYIPTQSEKVEPPKVSPQPREKKPKGKRIEVEIDAEGMPIEVEVDEIVSDDDEETKPPDNVYRHSINLTGKVKDWELWPEWNSGSQAKDKSFMHKHLEHAWQHQATLSQLEKTPLQDGEVEKHERCMLSPASNLRLSWDLVTIPMLLFDITTIPLAVFDLPNTTFMDVMSWVTVIFWTVDIATSFRTGHYDRDGNLEMRPGVVTRKYLRGRFAFDVLVVIPDWLELSGLTGLGFIASLRVFRIARIMKLMRLRKLKQILRMIQDYLDSEVYSSMMNVFMLIMVVLLICHYLGCVWFLLGDTEFEGADSWVKKQNFADDTWEYQYVTALHWAITQFTPGSMIVQPQNIPERWVAVLVLVFGMVGFSLIVSTLTKERLRLEKLTSKLDRDTWLLWRWLLQNGVHREARIRAMRYVEAWVAPKMNKVQQRDVELWPQLSKQLQMSLRFEMSEHKIGAHPMFAALNRNATYVATHIYNQALKEMSFAQTDVIFEPEELAKNMYFVMQDTVEYLRLADEQNFSIRKGGWLCEAALWVPWVHHGIAWAKYDLDMVAVSSSGFRSAMADFKLESSFMKMYAVSFVQKLNGADGKVDDNLGIIVSQDEISSIFNRSQDELLEEDEMQQEGNDPDTMVAYEQEMMEAETNTALRSL
jgi:hypothetical protein